MVTDKWGALNGGSNKYVKGIIGDDKERGARREKVIFT